MAPTISIIASDIMKISNIHPAENNIEESTDKT